MIGQLWAQLVPRSIKTPYTERRVVEHHIADPGAPVDSAPKLVHLPRPAIAPAPRPTPPGPARPAILRITVTRLRPDWMGRRDGSHVVIDRKSGRPRGQRAVWAEHSNIPRPLPASYGASFELRGMSEEDAYAFTRLGQA